MRTIREIVSGQTATPAERKRRRKANAERYWHDQTLVTPLERKADERIYGRTLGRLIALFAAAGD